MWAQAWLAPPAEGLFLHQRSHSSEGQSRSSAEPGGCSPAGPPPVCAQERNYQQRKEAERQRRAMFDAALADFKAGKLEDALITFGEPVDSPCTLDGGGPCACSQPLPGSGGGGLALY